MRNQKKAGVISALKAAVQSHQILTVSTLLCVAASVAASLIPPLLLKNIIDRLTGGMPLLFTAVLLYFCSLVLEGTLSSAQETLLVLFGQKMTHALRSEMSQKLIALPASTLVGQNPGEVAARFSGDVDAVEALFTSGIISMVADACRIISILAVIAVENMGLALVLLVILPLFAVFTRFVQKRMLAAQLENRRAVAAVSGQVPETLHNIRTIHALGLESYMEQRYDQRIGESYAATEKTNFFDAIYSPVVFLLNAAVVGISPRRAMRMCWHCSACRSARRSPSSTTFPAFFRRLKASAWRFRRFSPLWRVSSASTRSLISRNAPFPRSERIPRAATLCCPM